MITYNATYLNQKTADALINVINLRRKELGNTMKQAAVATVINILKSLRANTKVADLRSNALSIKNVTSTYTPSFSYVNGKLVHVLRNGAKGHTIKPSVGVYWTKAKNRCPLQSYFIEDVVGEGKTRKFIVVARNDGEAKKIANAFHKKRVKRFRKLAKYALGIAMNKLNTAQKISDSVEPEIAKTGLSTIKAEVNESGFNSGEVQIRVHDSLNYAALALMNGPNYVETAVQKTINYMTGNIIQQMKKNGKITDSISIPFPEVRN